MSFKNLIHRNHRKKPENPPRGERGTEELSPEQLHRLAMEAAWDYGVTAPWGFPDGSRHLY